MKQVAFADAKFVAAELYDARHARLDHFHRSANTEAHFFQPVNARGIPQKLIDAGDLAGGKHLKWKRITRHWRQMRS